jgi:hypothetical protein
MACARRDGKDAGSQGKCWKVGSTYLGPDDTVLNSWGEDIRATLAHVHGLRLSRYRRDPARDALTQH